MMNDRVSCGQPTRFVGLLVERVGILVKGGEPQKFTGPSSLSDENATDSVGTTLESYQQLPTATGGLVTVSPIHEVLASNTVQALTILTTNRAGVVLIGIITLAVSAPTMHGALTAVNL